MRLDHSFTVPAPPDRAWRQFLDLRAVAPCMPGAVLDDLDGDTFTGRVKVKVGAVQMSYRGQGTVTRREAERTVLLDLTGTETRGSGTAAATVRATLEDDPAGTRVRVRTDLDVTGRPAQFGRGIMAEVGDRIVGRFAERLAELMSTAPAAEPVPASEPAAGPAPAAASDPEPVDLGAAVLPSLLRRAAVPAAALAVAAAVLLVRRRLTGPRTGGTGR
ncbi:SRPBCC family protein [Actinomadura sp. WMMB 499]|uniref:SRPBCC family protein n=1 Tax=Actinomadura sp. WMMB 499 TaxID=1219491 RepID=UPI00124634E2|nr:SRPBCC family protein [Actinomadura sp. WMMB 499]QFG22971.1 hypothetical protein F7P10_19465 [Actinomadura sp. WMMB 499]